MEPESNRIKYKREITDSLEKEIVAFLNYKDGGIIYIGIDDKTHKIVGIAHIDALQLKLKFKVNYTEQTQQPTTKIL